MQAQEQIQCESINDQYDQEVAALNFKMHNYDEDCDEDDNHFIID